MTLAERIENVRSGTAHCMDHVLQLDDSEFDAATLLPGWNRRHVIAHLAYNAAALARLLDWAVTGVQTPMYESARQRGEEIERGADLDPKILRETLDQEIVALDRKWVGMPDAAWSAHVKTAKGRTVPASETIWMRAREVWIHAVDLANGATFAAVPDAVQSSLIAEIATGWRAQGWSVEVNAQSAGNVTVSLHGPHVDATTVSGASDAVLRWMTGRGAESLHAARPPAAPHWL
ncbi:maleylpyruvate isomerase family mycothiol-dependent enzyme [Mycobacterium sp. 3519A]|uniref:maleylpyruvate isomerase family mycothiol-dependent enzyme n=1 Tax=Mycobacterium sp. 3519A TaxID=2057184 RepID=UPI001F2E183A|nr:maleylpyruvate isomerase family mycothiol-dependent enzyme [Mycobacterium sp. 3519A]